MSEVLAASDLCVAILKNIQMFRTTYPNKVFDYMAAGRPVVLAIDGVIREVVEEADAGVFVAPGSAQALSASIDRLSRDPDRWRRLGANGRRFVSEHFHRRDQAREFARTIQELVAETPR